MESRTADIIQGTRKHIKKKPSGYEVQNEASKIYTTSQRPQVQPQMQTDQELQLKASRDVRWQLCITGSRNRNICVFAFFSSLEAIPLIGFSTENDLP